MSGGRERSRTEDGGRDEWMITGWMDEWIDRWKV